MVSLSYIMNDASNKVLDTVRLDIQMYNRYQDVVNRFFDIYCISYFLERNLLLI